MTEPGEITLEREFRCRPETLWRALTRPELIAEWLMQTDFAPEIGRAFTLRADWGQVDGVVTEIEPGRRLSYSWDSKDLRSTVTWTLEPTLRGTLLRLHQHGFAPDQRSYFTGARAGWPRFLSALETLLDRMPEDAA